MNIISIDKNTRKLKFIVDIIILADDESTENTTHSARVVIKLKNLENNVSRIHRYSDFLNTWRNKRIRTIINHANYIVPFLNYITFEIPKNELAFISDLTFEHAVQYLELYKQNKKRKTVLKCENTRQFQVLCKRKKLMLNLM